MHERPRPPPAQARCEPAAALEQLESAGGERHLEAKTPWAGRLVRVVDTDDAPTWSTGHTLDHLRGQAAEPWPTPPVATPHEERPDSSTNWSKNW